MFDNINECINYIETRKRSERSLENMFKLCEFFGNPEKEVKMIHVAGTNGKGSVVTYMRNVLCAAKYNVGTFTSPYIEKFNERIQINGEFISDEDVIKYTNLIMSNEENIIAAGISYPSFFSFITLMAFLYFRDKKVDIAIIEVGIGGLLDSTNVIIPEISIISNVSYDHMNLLGNTLQEIGSQKLGIVKKNVPFVTIENEEINDLIKSTCEKNNSYLSLVKRNDIKNFTISLGNTVFDYLDFENVKLNMSGLYQAENASLVIEASKILIDKGYNITRQNIYAGLFNAFWLGRLEVVSNDPLIILDGAHNIDGISRLYEFLKEIKKDKYLRLVMAISSNKDKESMIDYIEDIADEIIFTTFNYKRSEDGKVLFDMCNIKNKKYEENTDLILDYVLDDKRSNIINCFTGSLYFVSEMRKKIKK